MTNIRRPRVAAIGLDESQVDALRPLCGDLRSADSLTEYLKNHSWAETDVAVSAAFSFDRIDAGVHLFTIGPMRFGTEVLMLNGAPPRYRELAHTHTSNTEREMTVAAECPDAYMTLAAELNRVLSSAPTPPPVITVPDDLNAHSIGLVETTTRRPVALRLVIPGWMGMATTSQDDVIALLLPTVPNLREWFKAFLTDVHERDPVRVPQAPPRLSAPRDWYTPPERALAGRIIQIQSDVERLVGEREQLKGELAAESERADTGIRRAIWEDGDELVDGVCEILQGLGFVVRNMDAGRDENEAKREDLRLTRAGDPDWEAIVEVKGYTSGIRTNHARQIREHRDHYIKEKGRDPDLTLWIANPFRAMDPSSRPAPGSGVSDSAEIIGAVCALSTDLYRQWALVRAGDVQVDEVLQDLIDATPGLWSPDMQGGTL